MDAKSLRPNDSPSVVNWATMGVNPDWIKRAIDICVAFIGLLVFAPVMVALALMLYLTYGWPVLYAQSRPGHRGQPFTLLKFRTMRDAYAANGRLLLDAERLTRVGRILRSTSLDELPQLWNVLRGDMSLVGPRPLLLEYLPRYSPEQARRHEVRPGLTGWAQINGRNGIDWEHKFALDVWYVDHWSLWLDVRILARTPMVILRRKGVSAAGMVSMAPFLGSSQEAGHEQ